MSCGSGSWSLQFAVAALLPAPHLSGGALFPKLRQLLKFSFRLMPFRRSSLLSFFVYLELWSALGETASGTVVPRATLPSHRRSCTRAPTQRRYRRTRQFTRDNFPLSIMFRFLICALFLTIASAFQAPLSFKPWSVVLMNDDATRDPAPSTQSFDNDMCVAS